MNIRAIAPLVVAIAAGACSSETPVAPSSHAPLNKVESVTPKMPAGARRAVADPPPASDTEGGQTEFHFVEDAAYIYGEWHLVTDDRARSKVLHLRHDGELLIEIPSAASPGSWRLNSTGIEFVVVVDGKKTTHVNRIRISNDGIMLLDVTGTSQAERYRRKAFAVTKTWRVPDVPTPRNGNATRKRDGTELQGQPNAASTFHYVEAAAELYGEWHLVTDDNVPSKVLHLRHDGGLLIENPSEVFPGAWKWNGTEIKFVVTFGGVISRKTMPVQLSNDGILLLGEEGASDADRFRRKAFGVKKTWSLLDLATSTPFADARFRVLVPEGWSSASEPPDGSGHLRFHMASPDKRELVAIVAPSAELIAEIGQDKSGAVVGLLKALIGPKRLNTDWVPKVRSRPRRYDVESVATATAGPPTNPEAATAMWVDDHNGFTGTILVLTKGDELELVPAILKSIGKAPVKP